MIESGIRVLALDFDRTIVNIHTAGQWERSAKDLQKHVRKEFKCLIQASLEKGIFVAVTSFSKQHALMLAVLHDFLPKHHYRHVSVRGGHNQPEITGKKRQIDLALEDFSKMSHDKVFASNDAILLIDDDIYNIERCNFDGHCCIYFNPEKAASLLFEQIIVKMQKK